MPNQGNFVDQGPGAPTAAGVARAVAGTLGVLLLVAGAWVGLELFGTVRGWMRDPEPVGRLLDRWEGRRPGDAAGVPVAEDTRFSSPAAQPGSRDATTTAGPSSGAASGATEVGTAVETLFRNDRATVREMAEGIGRVVAAMGRPVTLICLLALLGVVIRLALAFMGMGVDLLRIGAGATLPSKSKNGGP